MGIELTVGRREVDEANADSNAFLLGWLVGWHRGHNGAMTYVRVLGQV